MNRRRRIQRQRKASRDHSNDGQDFGFDALSYQELLAMQEQAAEASRSSPWPAEALLALSEEIQRRQAEGIQERMVLRLGGAAADVMVKG